MYPLVPVFVSSFSFLFPFLSLSCVFLPRNEYEYERIRLYRRKNKREIKLIKSLFKHNNKLSRFRKLLLYLYYHSHFI